MRRARNSVSRPRTSPTTSRSCGAKTAARLITRYAAIEQFPPHVLGNHLERALLFKKLATLRTDAPLFTDVEALRWRGATDAFAREAEQIGAPGLITRIAKWTPTA